MRSIEEALRAVPGTRASGELLAWLDALDERRWEELLPAIAEIAREVAPRAADVIEADDLVGDFAVLAFESWLPRYLDELRQGSAQATLRAYLKTRLSRHVAELRRKRRRRRQLLAGAIPPATTEAEALHAARPSEPFDASLASELMHKAGSDREERAVIALKVAGFTQDEIAERLAVSRPTVSRRLAAVATTLAALIAAIGLTAWWFNRAEDAPMLTPEGELVSAAPRPAGGPDGVLADADAGAGEPREQRDLEWTKRWIDLSRARLEPCWRRHPAPAPLQLRAELTIEPSGRVSEALVEPQTEPGPDGMARPVGGTLPDDLRVCLERGFATFHFMPIRGDATTLSYLFQSPTSEEATPDDESHEGETDRPRDTASPSNSPSNTTNAAPSWRTPYTGPQLEPPTPARILELVARDCAAPVPASRATLQMRVEADGQVSDASATGTAPAEVRDCLERAARSWRFRPPESPQTVTVPITFAGEGSPSQGSLEAQARECLTRGDSQCAIRILEGHARSQSELGLLIESYRAQGSSDAAARHMRTFVERWGSSAQGRAYRQILSRQDPESWR